MKNSRSNYSSGNGTIMINGNGDTLQGNVVITSSSSMRVSDLMVIGGNYDASNNSAVSGSFYLGSNGNLDGSLMDNRGNTKEVIFELK